MVEKKNAYFFANWKMYLDYEESVELAQSLASLLPKFPSSITTVVFPSALAFYSVQQTLKNTSIKVGSQNIYWVEKGGYTGEISASMYKSLGSAYTLIGHSERRHLFHETNHEVRQKLEAALTVGLQPVLCIGEKLEEREQGKSEDVVEVQLRGALENLVWPGNPSLFIAYEPVWAVGTGVACDPAETERMHRIILDLVKGLAPQVSLKILYGGSVRPENIRSYINQEHVDGVLVGGASVKLDSWLEMINHGCS